MMDNGKSGGETGNFSQSIFSNKKGQGLSVNAIILIVLGIIVLVLMILGFTLGWSKILPFISANNVDKVLQNCQAACVTGGSFDFCNSKRELKADEINLKDVTCNYLVNNQAKYGIAACPSVSCDNVLLLNAVSDADLQGKCGVNAGKTVQALINNVLVSKDCPI